jgi:hypothetical protein
VLALQQRIHECDCAVGKRMLAIAADEVTVCH